MNETLPLLSARALTIGYSSSNQSVIPISHSLNLDLWPGKMVCLLGPNGAGKSTLMRTLAGLQPTLAGTVTIAGKPMQTLAPVELAQQLSLVLTERVEAGNLTVSELVALGRTPYTGWLGTLTQQDKERVDWAMDVTETVDFRQRRLHQLSDGERQKVMLARALAQDTPLILLDEPTAHLDLPNRVEMMRLLHQLARKTGKAILLSTHELDLALQAADQLWLIRQTGEMNTGVPEDLVLNGTFEAAFAKNGFHFDRTTGTFAMHNEASGPPISLDGTGSLAFWTRRALQREGFVIDASDTAICQIETLDVAGNSHWVLTRNKIRTDYTTLADVLTALQELT
ncbi:ABC transporter ATP-binding protein [Spirosoma jeollabukense]